MKAYVTVAWPTIDASLERAIRAKSWCVPEARVSVFDEVQFVDVTGTSKGKGFAGVMKRHGFHGQCGSHGTERKHRSPGSIGGRATNRGFNGRPKKGLRLPGQMGNEMVTTRNHPVVRVDKENNLLLIKGPLPGPNGGVLFIKKAITAKPKAKAAAEE